MILETARLKTINYAKADILYFTKGLLGFETLKKYLLIKEDAQSPFYFLQSIENPELCFILVYPNDFFKSYHIDSDSTHKYTHHFVIVTQREKEPSPTVNLLGPIIINKDEQQGWQIISNNSQFHTRHPLDLKTSSQTPTPITKMASL